MTNNKIKNETVIRISEYIHIDRAKILLPAAQMSLQTISVRLYFACRSFFTDTSAKSIGVPPVGY